MMQRVLLGSRQASRRANLVRSLLTEHHALLLSFLSPLYVS